jgi:hypothetical protein
VKKKSKILLTIILLAVVVLPVIALAQTQEPTGGIVPLCAMQGHGPCTLNDLLFFASEIFNYLVWLAVALSTLSFAIAGFYYITAGGDEGKLKKAHEIFYYAFIGMVLALGAYVIVNTVLKILGVRPEYQLE